MFDSLADRMKADDHQAINRTERMLRLGAVAVLSIALFGALYLGVQYLEF
jgi:hypothetical protein